MTAYLRIDAKAHVEELLRPLGKGGRLVTMRDGSPAALSWLGGVYGQRVRALGVDCFGRTGDLRHLYREYGPDADSTIRAAVQLCAR